MATERSHGSARIEPALPAGPDIHVPEGKNPSPHRCVLIIERAPRVLEHARVLLLQQKFPMLSLVWVDSALTALTIRVANWYRVFADLEAPGAEELCLLDQIAARGYGSRCAVIASYDLALIRRARALGFLGSIRREAGGAELARAVETTLRGNSSFPSARATVAELAVRLTKRQQQILKLVRNGQSNRKIGEALGICTGAVNNHMSQILERLSANNRTHAVALALALGLLARND